MLCLVREWTDMLSFKYLSMAFRKSGKPGQDVYSILFAEESFETNLIVVFVYVMVDCILCQNAFNRLIVNEFGCRIATRLNCC